MSSVDYMAFEQGMMTAEQQSRRASNAWSTHASGLQGELNSMAASKDGNTLKSNGAIKLITEMRKEIERLSSNSPFSDREYLTARLKDHCIAEANSQGYLLDYENSKAYPR